MKRLGLLVFVVTAAVFAPTVGFDFLRCWDDGGMLLFNANITRFDWRYMLGSIYFGHWMPLTWLTWTIDAHVWGLWAGGWHLENVLLHATNAVLVFVIAARLLTLHASAAAANLCLHLGGDCRRLARSTAFVVALLFSVHPMRIESVAWITERKDVLSGLFVLLALYAYVRYAADTTPGPRRRWYLLALLAFTAACFSKCIAVVLVPWLFLLDWAVFRRRALVEKVPFVAIAGATSLIAFYAVHVGIHNMLPWWKVGVGPRLLHLAYSDVYYVWRTLWPSRLSHMIEYTWVPTLDQAEYPVAAAVLVAALGVVISLRSRLVTAAVAGYLIAIFPQAGLFHNGPQLVANRYTYLACLPLALLVGAAGMKLARHRVELVRSLAASAVTALVVVTLAHLPWWTNDTTLWTSAAESEPTCTMCQDWAGVLAYTRGDLQATKRYFERAIPVSNQTMFPRYERHWGYGKVLEELGMVDEAIRALNNYLLAIPDDYRGYDFEQAHIRDAEARLVRLGGWVQTH